VVRWLRTALAWLPEPVRTERLAALRSQLISLFGQRAVLLDEQSDRYDSGSQLFLENLLDILVAGLGAEPSPGTLAAAADAGTAPPGEAPVARSAAPSSPGR
jgi:hypothetical protein